MKINFTGDRLFQLDNNLISEIDPENFNAMLDEIGRFSISIELASNQISSLKTGVFRDLENSWIGLNNNTIVEVEAGAIGNISFNSVFFLELAENVTFAKNAFSVIFF